MRVSDHAQPKEWEGNYVEGVNDFRNYADAYNYLSQFFDLSDKRKVIEEKRRELSEQVEEVEFDGEKAYRIKGNNAVFSTPEAAISNVITSDFVPRMTGQLVDEFAEDGVRFRDGDFLERDEVTARDYYERMVSSSGYQFREAMQDSMLGLRNAYEAILGGGKKFRIEEVPGNENAYLAENRMSSVNAAEQHNYFVECMKPLLEEIHKICGSKKALRQELTDYMMAKHGLERNEKFAQRDFDAYQQQNPTGGKTLGDFRERDYAGLTALTGMADVHDAELAAMQMVADFEARHDVSKLWAKTKKATGVTLAKIYLSGMLSEESYEQIRDQFEFYIPLQGFDETTSDEVYGYLTSRKGPFGSPIKHAEGRSSKADDPITTSPQ